MSYLLDTNVVSETARPAPEPAVIEWLERVPNEALHVSVLTLGEIRGGIERLRGGRRRERLRVWLEHDLVHWFSGRVVPIDLAVANRWGRLVAESGRPLPAVDALLAASALHHELRLVTRNVKHFAYPGLEVVDPWNAQ